jgi:lipopolysaccharide transport system ATP-binding protein
MMTLTMSELTLEPGQKQDDCAISVENISKFYRIPRERKTTVYENLLGLISKKYRSYDEFWALKDISFTVAHGETFGIIGPNGSGKSTLLKIMAGVLFADSGKVAINGKVAPFLELGVGFQPELTAKENVYLYGAIMGLNKKEVAQRYEEIMEFSELKRFENMRLKNFSSGMYVRLAFSTAIQVNPDIMLIDEVLAVGDQAFQEKCKSKINSFRKAGKTIILVTHDLTSVKQLCERCLLLNKGQMIGLGETDSIISQYHNMIR